MVTRSITKAAERVICRSRNIDERAAEEWGKLKGVSKWKFAEEIFSFAQARTEEGTHAAHLLKTLIDNCTDEEFQQMKKSKEDAKARFQLTETIEPLADIHRQSQIKKNHAKNRIKQVWGLDWEDRIDYIMPPFPAEEFLRALAVFAEKNQTSKEAKTILEERIALRISTRYTKKFKWLMFRDVADEKDTKKRREKGKKVVPPPEAEGEGDGGKGDGGRDQQVAASNGKDKPPASGKPSASGQASGSSQSSGSGQGSGSKVQDASRKRKKTTPSTGERKKMKIVGYHTSGIEIIDLDDKVDTLIREAKDDAEKEDALAIQQMAQATMIGQVKFNKEVTLRRLKGYMKLIGVDTIEFSDTE